MTTPIAFRYDFGESEQDQHFCSVISQTLDGYFPGVVGVETMNKYGETIKKHLHYHFLYPGDKTETEKYVAKIRKRIQRQNADSGAPRQRGYYSLTVPEVEDSDRWFRYCIKQVESFDKILRNERIPLPADFDLELQWKLGNEEYIRDREHLSSRRESADKRQTTLQKITQSYTEKKVTFTSIRQVFDFVLQFYDDEGLIMERMKIRGVCDTVARKVGLIPNDEFFRMVYN